MGTYFIHGKYAIYEILCLNGVVLAIQVDSNQKKNLHKHVDPSRALRGKQNNCYRVASNDNNEYANSQLLWQFLIFLALLLYTCRITHVELINNQDALIRYVLSGAKWAWSPNNLIGGTKYWNVITV